MAGQRGFDGGGPRLRDVGESAILAELTARARAAPGSAGLVVASGDDACSWRPDPGMEVVISQDCLVEGRDFRRNWLTPEALGRRAAHVAASDLAATGARPRLLLATLCAAGETSVADVVGIQAGLLEAAAELGMVLGGGDLSDIDGPLVLDITAVGEVEAGRGLRRDAGIAGDVLVVTGSLGRAAAGLSSLLGARLPVSAAVVARWCDAQLAPRARIAEGRALVAAGARCAGDLSDGLLVDATRTAAASGCAAELWVDRLPVDAELRSATGERWVELALSGGEDFELLAAVPETLLEELHHSWSASLTPLTTVGRLVAGSGVRLLATSGGAELTPPPPRSRHWS